MSSSRIRLSHDAYRVGWISALPLEKTAAIAMLDASHASLPQPKSDNNTYHLGEIGDHNIVIACLPSGRYGLTSAAVVSQQMLATFPSIELGLMVGIGGGVPSTLADIRLGDIVVSKPTGLFPGVVQYDYGKAMGDGSFHRTGSLNNPPDRLLTAISDLEANNRLGNNNIALHLNNAANMHPSMTASFIYPGVDEDILFEASYVHEDDQRSCSSCDRSNIIRRSPRESTTPRIHYGLIASANQVMKNAQTRDKLGEELGILCFEMEAAGLMNHFPCLVIRGICDYSDSHKNKQWQDYAAATAAAYARELLESSLPATLLPSASDAVKIRSKIPISKAVFFGRNDELRKVQESFDVEMHTRQVAVIWGPSGYGKTQLALEYLTSRDMNYEVVLWIDSSSRTMVEESFEQISLYLELGTKHMKSGVDSVIQWVEQQSRSWIIVFDGVESMGDDDEVEDLDIRDYFPASKHGHLLLVTTSSDLHLRLAYPGIEIEGVDEQTGAKILSKCAGITSQQTSNNKVAMAISRKLGGMPLAIEQAGSYLSYGMSSMADYKKFFETRFREPTLKTPMRKYVGSYEKGRTLWTTFDMLYHTLQQKSPDSARLLQLIAFLGRGRIPFAVITGQRGRTVQPVAEKSKSDHLENKQLSLVAPWLMELRAANIGLAMAVRQLEVSGFVKLHRGQGDTLIEGLGLHDLARSFLQSTVTQEERLEMIACSFLLNGQQLYDGQRMPEESIIRTHMGRLSAVWDQFQEHMPNSMLQPPDGRFFQLCATVAPLFARISRYRGKLDIAARLWAIAIQHRSLSEELQPHLEDLMEAAEIDSRLADLEGAIQKYSTIVSVCESGGLDDDTVYIRAVGRLRECRENQQRSEQHARRAAVATSAPKNRRHPRIDEGEAREESQWSPDEYAGFEDESDKEAEEDRLIHAHFREIINYPGADAAVALAYLDLRVLKYCKPHNPWNNAGRYGRIVREALARTPPSIEALSKCHNATAAVTIGKDLDLARSWAATFGSTALSTLLSSEEAPANLRSLRQGHVDMIDRLVQAGETDTALCWAAFRPQYIRQKILTCLMANDTFDPARIVVDVMRRPWSRSAFQVILNLGVDSYFPALLCAVCANNEIAIAQLLSGGADPCQRDDTGNTGLHFAARAGRTPLIKTLLNSGAVASQVNNAGRTALHEAATTGRHMTIRTLLENGSNVNEANRHGQAALHLAFQGPLVARPLVLGVLLEYHASVSQQDNNGRTALHYASAEHTDDQTATNIVQLLVDAYRGDRKRSSLPVTANGLINICDGKGRTALHEAQSVGNTDIYNLLVDAAENSTCSDNTGLNGTRKKGPDWRGRWKLWTLT